MFPPPPLLVACMSHVHLCQHPPPRPPTHLLPWLPLEAQVWFNDELHTSGLQATRELMELWDTECRSKVRHGYGVTINLVG